MINSYFLAKNGYFPTIFQLENIERRLAKYYFNYDVYNYTNKTCVKVVLDLRFIFPKAKYDGKITIFSFICKIAGISTF